MSSLTSTLFQNQSNSSSSIINNYNNHHKDFVQKQQLQFPTIQQQHPTMMLHRTPSGAQKKIRQRKEEK